MKLHRTAACVVFVALCIAGDCEAQPGTEPVPDPDAKGTVSITAQGADGTSITASGALTTVTGYSTGGVTLYASVNTGGRVRSATATVKQGTWSASIANVPNGTYTIYAFHTVTPDRQQKGGFQLVSTPLGSVTVKAANNPYVEVNGGTIAFGQNQPARASGGAAIGGSGTYTIKPPYKMAADANLVRITMVTIPKDGGVVRRVFSTMINNGVWSNPAPCYVPSSLTYNVVVTMMAARPDPNDPPIPPGDAHNVNSKWEINK